jgi:PAS domain S-box-containing protein
LTAEQVAQILVVDDNPQNVALMKAQLERAGYAVISAQSGTEALDAAFATQPDLVLLDIMMPGLDGYEVCRRLREDESTQATPIIMLTSLQDRADKLRALETGADDFLSKPVDRAELLARVRSSLRMKRVYDDLARSKRETEAQAYELAAEKSRAEAILSSMSDGVLMTDAEGRITFLNPAVEAMTGASLEACLGRAWYEALAVRNTSGQPLDANNCPVMEAMRGIGHMVERELGIWREDGREITISLAASPVRSSHEDIQGGVVVFRDVTSAREVQRMKEDFVGLVSHELRTPLAAIFGFAELLLERERLTNTARTFVETIFKEADRMTSLVNDFLDIERLASGRMSFHLRSLQLDEVVGEVREDLANQLAKHSFTLETPSAPVYVRADHDRLVQILLNLISNASKYSPDGGEIRVRIEPVGRLVRVSVSDKGLGLPVTAIPKLFQRFYRVQETPHRSVGGTGLGLAICKQIVEAMGGRIWAESPGLGQGSTFSFTLPAAGAPVYRTADAPLGSAGRILLAKDDPIIAATILQQLGPLGYAVEAVTSGDEAIARARTERPVAVVLDIGVGSQPDGWGILVALRDDAATAEIPIILVSGASGQEHGQLALAADEYLVKPARSQRLIGAVHRLGGEPSDRPVVVADDDPIHREMVEEILVGAGFQVLTAHDGDSALEALRRSDPAALVLDLLMPNQDGFDVLSAIRSDARLHDLPVLVVIPKELPEEERQLLQSRASETLRKPGTSGVNIAEALLRTIRSRRAPAAPAACAMPQRETRTVQTPVP